MRLMTSHAPRLPAAAQGHGRKETGGDGVGVSQEIPLPVPSVDHRGGLAIKMGASFP